MWMAGLRSTNLLPVGPCFCAFRQVSRKCTAGKRGERPRSAGKMCSDIAESLGITSSSFYSNRGLLILLILVFHHTPRRGDPYAQSFLSKLATFSLNSFSAPTHTGASCLRSSSSRLGSKSRQKSSLASLGNRLGR